MRTLFILLLLVVFLAATIGYFVYSGVYIYSINLILPFAAVGAFMALINFKTKDIKTSFSIGGIFFASLLIIQHLYFEMEVFPRLELEGKTTTGEVIYIGEKFSGGGVLSIVRYYQYDVSGRKYIKSTDEEFNVGQRLCIKYLLDRPDVHRYYKLDGNDCKDD